MDNRAFQNLVRERTSLKKVARDAVEDEFRRKKKRRRGKRSGDVDSSDDEQDERPGKKAAAQDEEPEKEHRGDAFGANMDEEKDDLDELEHEIKDLDDDDDEDDEDRGGEAQTAMKSAAKKKSAPEPKKYRDRAKERREGKNEDYDKSDELLQGVDAAADAKQDENVDRVAMSKYLGGDEAHTHLVKGLDTVLANKVRREMRQSEKSKSKSKSKSAKSAGDIDQSIGPVETKEEAMSMLKNYLALSESNQAKHQLDSQWHDYVEQFVGSLDRNINVDRIEPSTRGLGMTMIFAASGKVTDIGRSWEKPQLVPESSRKNRSREVRGTPLSSSLISRIEALEKQKASMIISNPVVQLPVEGTGSDQHDLKASEKEESERIVEDSDDDDIFGDAGEYKPPQA